jgi:hypothetical protein
VPVAILGLASLYRSEVSGFGAAADTYLERVPGRGRSRRLRLPWCVAGVGIDLCQGESGSGASLDACDAGWAFGLDGCPVVRLHV